jgi:glutamate racemase
MSEGGGSGPVIGVFDSGMGGLTVLRALIEAEASARYLYLGDTARLPYGTKSEATVKRYALLLGRFLVHRGVDLLVVACNTVSAVALDVLEAELNIPVIGVVGPGAAAAVAAGGPIAVLGTEATIGSGAYPRAIARLDPSLEVRSRACPLFVPLVEEGWTAGDVPRRVAEHYLDGLGDARTILLGCTHYPLLAEVVHKVVPAATVVDSASVVAAEVKTRTGGGYGCGPDVRYFVTDSPARFLKLGPLFLGREPGSVELIDV